MKQTLRVHVGGVEITWSKKRGFVIDAAGHAAAVLRAVAAHPVKPGETPQTMNAPALGLSNVPTSRAARAEIDNWEKQILAQARTDTEHSRAAIHAQAQQRQGSGVRGLMRVSLRALQGGTSNE